MAYTDNLVARIQKIAINGKFHEKSMDAGAMCQQQAFFCRELIIGEKPPEFIMEGACYDAFIKYLTLLSDIGEDHARTFIIKKDLRTLLKVSSSPFKKYSW